MDRSDAPQILRDFLIYHETIRGHSKATVDEYYLDLRTFFRFLKLSRGLVPRTTELDEISIADVDVPFVASVTLAEVYDFLAYLARDRVKQANSPEPEYGLSAASRARKISAIRSFFKYLTMKAKLLDENPVQDLDSPKIHKTLPRYLTLEESQDRSLIPYGFLNTNSQLDHAYVSFRQVVRTTTVLAEVENSIYRLATAIKKTQRRANALRNILIPRYEEIVKFITDNLEEKEREEFARMKVIKIQKRKVSEA